MSLLSGFLTAIVLLGTASICWILYGDRGGKTHCIACGKCVADGVCILTGEKVPKISGNDGEMR